jgi:hypothetical protein
VANWQAHFFSEHKSLRDRVFAEENEFANAGKLTWQTGKFNGRLRRRARFRD